MTLVDSSSWIEALRPHGNPEVKQRVAGLLDAGDASWCDMIRLELWRGAKGAEEKAVLQHFDRNLIVLDAPEVVWKDAVNLMIKAREHGLIAPPPDVIIAATAKFHNVNVEHCDKHLESLLKLV